MSIIFFECLLLICCCLHTSANNGVDPASRYCFCKLKGQINDCSCDVDTVDHYNNVKIQPRLQSIVLKDYFKFFQVNLRQSCPFWHDDFKCSMRYCSVEHCTEADIPDGLRHKKKYESTLMKLDKHQGDATSSDCDEDDLGFLNTTIRPDFSPNSHYGGLIPSSHLQDMCLEKRVFYRVISGLHSSINIHLCAKYLLSDRNSIQPWQSEAKWGMNLEEFRRRFSPEFTEGEGPVWLQNLYFVYLLELKAIAKASPYLEQELEFPEHFDETAMFTGGDEAARLKDSFRSHFRNISNIMDCVGCEKCKLWGKLQVSLGTALKILFSGKFDQTPMLTPKTQQFHLKRGEIVALFNSICRLSSSINHLETFRNLMR
ncbi:hypothetical protein M8J75_001863 [Diaphorina citri]|nr:hypothetical protein M8J75_001863 [Diaphorina citri]